MSALIPSLHLGRQLRMPERPGGGLSFAGHLAAAWLGGQGNGD